MADEGKNITTDDIEKAYEGKFVGEDTFTWNGLAVKVKKVIPLERVFLFVRSVATGCFSTENGEYIPEARDFWIRYETLNEYTNIAVGNDASRIYSLLYCTDIYDKVVSRIDKAQYDSVMSSVEKRIEYQAQGMISAAVRQVNEVVNGLSGLEENMAKMFEGVEPGDMKAVVSAISENGLDANSLVDAVMKNRQSTTGVI